MINEQLLNYIRQSLAGGISKENTKTALMSSGWAEQDIEEGFLTVSQTSNNIQTPEQQSFTPQTTNTNDSAETPQSVKYFEVSMYLSIVLSILATVFQYSKYLTSTQSFYILLYPALSVVMGVIFTYFAARKKANWARQVLLVLFIIGLPSLLSVFSIFFISRNVNLGISILTGLLMLVQMVLKVLALYFIFSRPSNEWFSPNLKTANNPTGADLVNGVSTIWTKTIPKTNMVFMVISLILVFGVDLFILISSPSLASFWYMMLGVLAVFVLFFFLENFIFKVKFANTTSNLDSSIATLIGLRNLLFLANFIPLVQIIGLAGDAFIGWAIILVYIGLLIARSKQTNKLQSI